MGVNGFVNYREENFESVIDPVDIVVDTVGGDTRHRSVDVLDENGELISVVGTAPEPIETETGNTVTAVSGSSNQPALLTTISEKVRVYPEDATAGTA